MSDTENITKPIGAPDLMRVIEAATDAMTDSMIERLSTTAGNTMEVVDILNDEDTRETIIYAVERLTELHRIGALESIFSIVEVVHGARMAMTDSMVTRLVGFVEHMATNLANEDMATMVGEAYNALEDAIDETKSSPPATGGLLSTISLLTKPETQATLRFMLTVADKMQTRFKD